MFLSLLSGLWDSFRCYHCGDSIPFTLTERQRIMATAHPVDITGHSVRIPQQTPQNCHVSSLIYSMHVPIFEPYLGRKGSMSRRTWDWRLMFKNLSHKCRGSQWSKLASWLDWDAAFIPPSQRHAQMAVDGLFTASSVIPPFFHNYIGSDYHHWIFTCMKKLWSTVQRLPPLNFTSYSFISSWTFLQLAVANRRMLILPLILQMRRIWWKNCGRCRGSNHSVLWRI